jgi:transketolase
VKAADILAEKGIKARVVSMPSWELFDREQQNYKEWVLLPDVKKRIAVEAGITMGWEKYVGDEGVIIGIDHYGASAPGGTVMKEFGFTVENVVENALKMLGKE